MNKILNNNIEKLLYLLLYFPCFLVSSDINNDIWFILNNGRYVLENGIPYIEPFTIHQGMSYVMQQWLSSIIFWEFYKIFGNAGLILIVFFIYILFTYLTFKLCMQLSDNNFLVSFIISIVTVECISIFMTQRPYIFLFIIILVEILTLEKYIKSNRWIYLVPLIPLSILLVNLEAAMWPILFVILIPYLIDSFKFKLLLIEGQGYCKKNLFIAVLGMAVAGLINPYGVKAPLYLHNSYGYAEISNSVIEMKSLNINNIDGKIMITIMALVFFSFFIYKCQKNRLRYYLLALGTSYMTFSSIRSYSFFIICGIIPLSYYFKDFYFVKRPLKNHKNKQIIRKFLVFLMSIIIIVMVVYKIYSYNCTSINTQQQDLIKCVNLLESYCNKSTTTIYTGYGDGGYLEFRGFKVYIDARADVFLKTNNVKFDVMKEYIEMQNGKIYYKQILNKYNFSYLLVSKNDILFIYLDHDMEYNLIYSTENYKIYKKLND